MDGRSAEQTSRRIEARRRTRDVEATVLEIEALGAGSRRNGDRVHELIRQAQADREEAEHRAAKILEAALSRAADLFEASRLAREEVQHLLEEARGEVDCFVEEVEAAAERCAVAVMNQSQPHLDEIRRGLDLLDAQRQAVLADLFRLRETLDGLAEDVLRAG